MVHQAVLRCGRWNQWDNRIVLQVCTFLDNRFEKKWSNQLFQSYCLQENHQWMFLRYPRNFKTIHGSTQSTNTTHWLKKPLQYQQPRSFGTTQPRSFGTTQPRLTPHRWRGAMLQWHQPKKKRRSTEIGWKSIPLNHQTPQRSGMMWTIIKPLFESVMILNNMQDAWMGLQWNQLHAQKLYSPQWRKISTRTNAMSVPDIELAWKVRQGSKLLHDDAAQTAMTLSYPWLICWQCL